VIPHSLLLVGGRWVIVSARRPGRPGARAFEAVETMQRRIGRKAERRRAEIGTDEGLFLELRSRVNAG